MQTGGAADISAGVCPIIMEPRGPIPPESTLPHQTQPMNYETQRMQPPCRWRGSDSAKQAPGPLQRVGQVVPNRRGGGGTNPFVHLHEKNEATRNQTGRGDFSRGGGKQIGRPMGPGGGNHMRHQNGLFPHCEW